MAVDPGSLQLRLPRKVVAVTVSLNGPSMIFWRCIGKALSSVHKGQILEFTDFQLVEVDLKERVCSNVDLHRSRILFG